MDKNKGFGTILVIIIIALFILWLLIGGPKDPNVNNPIEKPYAQDPNVYVPQAN